eukprot:2411470-Lingulodinium_polyedra.AAC.1
MAGALRGVNVLEVARAATEEGPPLRVWEIVREAEPRELDLEAILPRHADNVFGTPAAKQHARAM